MSQSATEQRLPRYHPYLGPEQAEFPLDGGWQMKRSEHGAWARIEDVRALLSERATLPEGPSAEAVAAANKWLLPLERDFEQRKTGPLVGREFCILAREILRLAASPSPDGNEESK